MNNESQMPKRELEPSEGGFNWILLVALVAFIVFVAVAVILIVFDTRGLYYPGWEPDPYKIYPHLSQLINSCQMEISKGP